MTATGLSERITRVGCVLFDNSKCAAKQTPKGLLLRCTLETGEIMEFSIEQRRFVCWCLRRTRVQLVDLLMRADVVSGHYALTLDRMTHDQLVNLMLANANSNALMDLYNESKPERKGD